MKHVLKTDAIILAVVLAALPLGCKTNDSNAEETVADSNIAGTYTLAMIEGNPIPYAPMHLGRRQPTVVSGDLTLRETGAFASTMQYADDSGRTMTRTFAGTYRAEEDEYILKWEGAGTTTVTIEGDSLTMLNEGMSFVYKK